MESFTTVMMDFQDWYTQKTTQFKGLNWELLDSFLSGLGQNLTILIKCGSHRAFLASLHLDSTKVFKTNRSMIYICNHYYYNVLFFFFLFFS